MIQTGAITAKFGTSDKWDNVTGIFLRPRGRSKSLWMQQPGNGAALKRAVTANLNG